MFWRVASSLALALRSVCPARLSASHAVPSVASPHPRVPSIPATTHHTTVFLGHLSTPARP